MYVCVYVKGGEALRLHGHNQRSSNIHSSTWTCLPAPVPTGLTDLAMAASSSRGGRGDIETNTPQQTHTHTHTHTAGGMAGSESQCGSYSATLRFQRAMAMWLDLRLTTSQKRLRRGDTAGRWPFPFRSKPIWSFPLPIWSFPFKF